MMMPRGAPRRGKQITTLTGLARDLATGDAMLGAIEGARRELGGAAVDDLRLRAVEDAAAAIAPLTRIPAKLVADAAELKTKAQAI